MDQEIWKIIPSTNGKYEASNYGRIKNAKTQKILKLQENVNGYYCLALHIVPTIQSNVRVHRLVAEAFLGECPKGYVVNHKDGNKHNNNITNLEYVTPSENNYHAIRNGLRKPNTSQLGKHGEEAGASKISEEQAIAVLKEYYRTGDGYRKISKRLGISLGIVQGILSKSRPRWIYLDREKIKKEVECEKEERKL